MSGGSDVIKCPECASRSILHDDSRGEVVCEDCGLVLRDTVIDPGAEWTAVTSRGDERSRVGAPASLFFHDKGLSTDIADGVKDYSGRTINPKLRSQMYRMKKWNQRARVNDSRDRNMSKAIQECTRLGAALGLNKAVQEEAILIYRRALDKNLIRGRSIEAMMGACVYLANQQLKAARSLDDVERASGASRKSITRAQKVIKHSLKLRISLLEPEDFVDRYCNMLGLKATVQAHTRDIISRARERELTHGKSPTGVAAAAVYIASREMDQIRTQREISDISGVTEVTIRNRYKELAECLGIELE